LFEPFGKIAQHHFRRDPTPMPESRETIDEPLLVLRCQAGDEAAFAQIVQRYHARVHYYLVKMLGSADRADDALQELWIDVIRSIGKLRDVSAWRSWLYRIARDRAFRTIRCAKSRPVGMDIASIDVPDEEDDEEFSPEDVARVHRALDQLNPEHREVLLLRFVESMTYPQIASVVGCELGTVRSRIHYAKRSLRQLLERTSYEPEPVRSAVD
jgi:RNA polymerase sigma-70 factor (ECF subfamily)